MSKKNQKERVGSMDFNVGMVQTSFALGGPAFNIHEARAEAIEAQMGPNMGKHHRMTTIDPEMSTRLQDSGGKGAPGAGRGRNNQHLIQTR
jgi:hypothetical protein